MWGGGGEGGSPVLRDFEIRTVGWFGLQDIMFILHAEHEMNCSTAAARHLASSGVDVYTAVAGAVGALYGPLHGGANEAVLRMLERIGSVANVPAFIEGVKSRKEKLFGFGHRVYKNFDPRAAVIREVTTPSRRLLTRTLRATLNKRLYTKYQPLVDPV